MQLVARVTLLTLGCLNHLFAFLYRGPGTNFTIFASNFAQLCLTLVNGGSVSLAGACLASSAATLPAGPGHAQPRIRVQVVPSIALRALIIRRPGTSSLAYLARARGTSAAQIGLTALVRIDVEPGVAREALPGARAVAQRHLGAENRENISLVITQSKVTLKFPPPSLLPIHRTSATEAADALSTGGSITRNAGDEVAKACQVTPDTVLRSRKVKRGGM